LSHEEMHGHHRERLRHAREALGWSQEDVADLLGTTQNTIHRWETGIETPHPSFRQRLCELFEKSPDALDLGDEPEFLLSSTPTYQAILDPWIPLLSHPLVGRDQELARLRQHLCAVPMVTLQGLPGVGKTTLASALAQDPLIRATFSDGVLWVGLGVHPDLQYHLARWGRLLGLSETELSPLRNEDRQEALRHALEARQMLLVIDDACTEDDVRAFQLGGLRCATFITTRFPPLASAFGRSAQTLRELNTEESLDLLHVLVPQVVEREPEQVRLLAETVGGLPLALTLTGNYLRVRTHTGQDRRIQAALI
jgi:transcriptional regulator with XRE-family HTH domain